MLKCFVAVFALSLLWTDAVAAENQVYPAEIANWSPAEKQRQADNARKLVADFRKAVAEGRKVFVLPKDHYRFGAKDLPYWLIEKISDITIEGNGSTIWSDGRSTVHHAIRLVSCRDVTIRNITMDCDPFSYIQTTVNVVDPVKKELLVTVDPGFPRPDDPAGKWNSYIGVIKAIFLKPDGSYIPQRLDWVKSIAPVEGGRFRVILRDNAVFNYKTPVTAGDKLVLPDRGGRNAISIDGSEKVTLEKITIYASGHMGISEVCGAGGHVYRQVRVIRRPGTGRLIACNADVFHSIMVRNGPTIDRCEFSHACDDLINIHGFFGLVVKQDAPDEAIVAIEYQPVDLTGETVTFYDWNRENIIGEVKVVASTLINDPELKKAALAMPEELRRLNSANRIRNLHPKTYPLKLKLAKALTLPRYALVDQYAFAGRGTTIRDSYFHHSTARGVLVKTDRVKLENNRVEYIGHAGVLVASDRYFLESAVPRNVVIGGNTIADTNLFLSGQLWFNGQNAALGVFCDGRNQAFSRQAVDACRNIVIENNRIVNAPGNAILLTNTAGGRIVGNVIVAPGRVEPVKANPELAKNYYAVYLANDEKITVKDNRLEQPGPYCRGLIGQGPNIKNCTIENNIGK